MNFMEILQARMYFEKKLHEKCEKRIIHFLFYYYNF